MLSRLKEVKPQISQPQNNKTYNTLIYRFSRAKSEALDNIYSLLKQKNNHVMLSGEGNENGEKNKNRAVYARENKPRLTLAAVYIRRERKHLCEYGLY